MRNNRKRIFVAVLLMHFCGPINWVYSAELPKLPANTVITSDRVEMDLKDNINTFHFYGNVHLEGEGMDAVCDELEVISNKTEGGEGASMDNVSSFEKITAIGHILIKQEDRVIKAGHAVFSPAEGKVVLTDNPEVTDSQGTVKGDRIIFNKNDGKAYVEGGPQGGRPRIILPSMPDRKKESASGTRNVEKIEAKELATKKE